MITDTVTGCVIMVGMAVGIFLSVMLLVYVIYLFYKEWEDEKNNE